MKITIQTYCVKHGEKLEIKTTEYDTPADIVPTEEYQLYLSACSQCQAESYEKGIESVLEKGYTVNEGEI